MSTHRARIKPTSPRDHHFTLGIAFERSKGWYVVTADQADYLAKQPLHEGQPNGEKLFDAGTKEWAEQLERAERRAAVNRGSAKNAIGEGGEAGMGQDEADELRAELAAARAEGAKRDAVLAAVLQKMGMTEADLVPASPVVAPPDPKKEDAPLPLAKSPRPGARPKAPPAAEKAEGAPPTGDGATPAESAASAS